MKYKILFIFNVLISFIGFSQDLRNDSLIVSVQEQCKYVDFNYFDSASYQWTGECKAGWLEGYGELKALKNGKEVYTIVSHFEKGLAQGQGTFFDHADEIKFSGPFQDGKIYGVGEYWNGRGDYYKGYIRNYVLHGKGKIIYSNGSEFEGLFYQSNFWTGVFTSLQEEKINFLKGKKVEKLSSVKEYNPRFGELITEYFDEDWKRCEKKEAAYFRKIIYSGPNTPKGKVKDYYINGQPQNEFYASYIDYGYDELTFHKKAKAIYFYKNGVISSVCHYNHQSQKTGQEYDYYESGELYSVSTFGRGGFLDGPVIEYYEDGKLRGYSNYDEGSRVDNAYWQISRDGEWIGVFHTDLALNKDRFRSSDDCAGYFNYNEIAWVELTDEECIYYQPEILTSSWEFPFSLELNVVIDNPKKDKLIGLIFNYIDDDNLCLLKLDAFAHFTLVKYVNDVEQILIPWSSCDIVESKSDVRYDILLSFLNEECILAINDIEVGRVELRAKESMVSGLLFKGKGLNVLREFGEIVYYDESTSRAWTKGLMGNTGEQESEAIEDEYLGNGSGFLVSNDGYIATNYHVISDANEIFAVFDFEKTKVKLKAEVISTDEVNDIALLKVDLSGYSMTLPYTIGGELQEVGSPIFSLGYPYASVMGSEVKYTNGTISARTGIKGDVRYYQVSAPIQPGNSGGPCFNEQGEVIGIVTMGLNNEVYQNQNVNYVLKVSYLQNMINLLPRQSFVETTMTVDQKNKSSMNMVRDFKQFIPVIYTK
jgi:antitoxin component YwqK of YwqJK toxin-antitoxin module